VQEFFDVYDLMLQHTSYQIMLYANNDVQIGSTRSIVFSRNVSIDLHHCLELQSTLFSQSVPHKQSSVQVKLCLLHEHLWVCSELYTGV